MDSYDDVFFNDEASNLLICDTAKSSFQSGYALYAAILEQSWYDLGYYDINKPHDKQHRLYLDSYEWFMTVGEIGPTSFDSISAMFDINPDSVRSLLRKGRFPMGNKTPHLVTHAKSNGLIGGIESSLALRKMMNGDIYAKINTPNPIVDIHTSPSLGYVSDRPLRKEDDTITKWDNGIDRCVG